MVLFDPDYAPTRKQSFQAVAALALVATLCGMLFWAGFLDQDNSVTWIWPLVCLPTFVLSHASVKAWLERGRRQSPGVWRTARMTRLNALFGLIVMAAWQFDLARMALRLWREGDLPRLAVVGGIGLLMIVCLVLGVWTLRSVQELIIDARGIDARAWRGLVPWSAIAELSASRSDETALTVKLKPEAVARLPRPLVKMGPVVTLPLDRAGLTAEAALEAVAAVRPDLIAARPRSAGMVLPVRGATDIVEADL